MVYTWKKSSRSAPSSQCIETSAAARGAAVRDSKLGDRSPLLHLNTSQYASFIAAVRRDHFTS